MWRKICGITLIVFAVMIGNVFANGNNIKDSRVTVIVLEKVKGKVTHGDMAESVLNEKLLDAGFKYVLDAAQVIRLDDAQLMEAVYRGIVDRLAFDADNATDYLILGKSEVIVSEVILPVRQEGIPAETPLKNARATFVVEIMKYDTGEIIGTFTTDGVGFGNTSSQATFNAINNVSNLAAEKISDSFNKFAKDSALRLTFKIYAIDEEALTSVLEDLHAVEAIRSMHIREQTFRSAVISIESNQSPSAIVNQLKKISHVNISVDKISSSLCELRAGNDYEIFNTSESFNDVDDIDVDAE